MYNDFIAGFCEESGLSPSQLSEENHAFLKRAYEDEYEDRRSFAQRHPWLTAGGLGAGLLGIGAGVNHFAGGAPLNRLKSYATGLWDSMGRGSARPPVGSMRDLTADGIMRRALPSDPGLPGAFKQPKTQPGLFDTPAPRLVANAMGITPEMWKGMQPAPKPSLAQTVAKVLTAVPNAMTGYPVESFMAGSNDPTAGSLVGRWVKGLGTAVGSTAGTLSGLKGTGKLLGVTGKMLGGKPVVPEVSGSWLRHPIDMAKKTWSQHMQKPTLRGTGQAAGRVAGMGGLLGGQVAADKYFNPGGVPNQEAVHLMETGRYPVKELAKDFGASLIGSLSDRQTAFNDTINAYRMADFYQRAAAAGDPAMQQEFWKRIGQLKPENAQIGLIAQRLKELDPALSAQYTRTGNQLYNELVPQQP